MTYTTRRPTVKVHACVAHYPPIGPISSDTMNARDLIPALMEAADSFVTLSTLVEISEDHDVDNVAKLHDADTVEDMEPETQSGILECLFEELDNVSPPYAHFGSQEGDGACYGWWADVDRLMDTTRHGWVKCADIDCDGAMEPDDRLCATVSDHGNVTLAHVACDGSHHEIWAVV